jgi:hypothetical protein
MFVPLRVLHLAIELDSCTSTYLMSLQPPKSTTLDCARCWLRCVMLRVLQLGGTVACWRRCLSLICSDEHAQIVTNRYPKHEHEQCFVQYMYNTKSNSWRSAPTDFTTVGSTAYIRLCVGIYRGAVAVRSLVLSLSRRLCEIHATVTFCTSWQHSQ